MRSRLWLNLFRGSRTNDLLTITTYVGFLLALVPTAGAVLSAVQHHQWVGVAAWCVFLAAILAIGTMQLLRKAPVSPPRNQVFQPFVGDLKDLDAWPRPVELKALLEKMDMSSTPSLVIGPSGAGKTVLLRKLLGDSISDSSWSTHYVDHYAIFRRSFEGLLDRITSPSTPGQQKTTITIIILDQFEQYLAILRSLDSREREKQQEWLRDCLLSVADHPRVRIVLSLRYEWYYDLRFLLHLIPSPVDCIDVSGSLADFETDATSKTALSRFEAVIGDEEVAEEVVRELGRSGRLLPLEAQIVGAVLERDRLLGRRISRRYLTDTLGGIEGAIDEYFDGILRGAPDRRVTLKVLCSLSVRTRFRTQEDLSEILDLLFEDEEQVRDAVRYLADQGLLVSRGSARYELTHDYLAEFFHQKSGSELDPVDRDNVLFHVEGGPGHMSTAVLPRDVRETSHRPVFAGAVIWPLLALATVRLLYLGIPWIMIGKKLGPQPLWSGKVFDLAYLPIYVAHFSWSIYVALFYRRLFAQLNEDRRQRFFSRFMVVNMALCVIVAMFAPYFWLASIGWGGIVVGLKLLSVSRRGDLNIAARARFRLFGVITTVNLVFLSLLGAIGSVASFTLVGNNSSRLGWIYISCALSVMMSYACLALGPPHVQRPGVAQLLGLLARSRRGTVPRPHF